MNDLKPEILENKSPSNEMTKYAINQFIGFQHAEMGDSIEELAEAMALTTE